MSDDDLLAQANKGSRFDQQAYNNESREADALQWYVKFLSQALQDA